MDTDLGMKRADAATSVFETAPKSRSRLEAMLQLATREVTENSRQPDAAELRDAAKRVNEVLRAYGVEFSLSETGSRIVTRLVDRENGELIRQIPGEAVLRAAEHLDDLSGVLFREQA